jgi:NAD-dependent deacetylase
MNQKIVVLTGAGVSAESGIQTFRDAGGLWEGHNVQQVASPEGFKENPALVLEFYNQRRRIMHTVVPNAAHLALVKLEEKYDTQIITQNIDDLHERAGSHKILHLHGELIKARSSKYPYLIYHWENDIVMGDLCERGAQLRPHIVWFGEEVPLYPNAAIFTAEADIVIIIGTSMQVYPAAGLVAFADPDVPIYYIDPKPHISHELKIAKNLIVIAEPATVGVPKVVDELLKKA